MAPEWRRRAAGPFHAPEFGATEADRCAIAPLIAPLLPGLTAELHATGEARFESGPSADHLLAVRGGTVGRFFCRIDGQYRYGMQSPGDIDLLPVGSVGSWELDPLTVWTRFRFSPALVRSVAESIGLDTRFLELTPQLQVRDVQIEHIVATIGIALSETPIAPLYAESLGTALLARVVGRFASAPAVQPKYGLSKRQLQRAIDHIDAHPDADLSLAALAAVVGLSVSHFRAQFRRSAGMPVHQFIIKRRVERARDLLMQGRSISEAAFETGFADQSHLARCMRRVLGVLPLEVVRLGADAGRTGDVSGSRQRSRRLA